MLEINGKCVSGSVAMGKLHFIGKNDKAVKRVKVSDCAAELERLSDARRRADDELSALYDKALSEIGDANAQIFQIHRLMLGDEDFYAAIENTVKSQSVNAEYAVSYASDLYAKTFEEMDDEYMKARAADVHDIADRMICILCGGGDGAEKLSEPAIIAAYDLSPSETVQLDRDKILGFVTFGGSPNSHTAILARTMGIPAIIGTGGIDTRHEGETAVLDGTSGTLYINPDENTVADFRIRKNLEEERNRLLAELRGKPTETKSGKRVKLYANIGRPSDVSAVLQNDAEGIGLFRSEFLYLESSAPPTEEEQFRKYKEVAERMGGRPVIIRTMDIGADKRADYLGLPHEENPALGYRAIRICLTQPEIFKTQLRAILRASAYGRLAVMFPMIASLSEVRSAKNMLEEAKQSLTNDGIPFCADIETGIMIETPAAALISDSLAAEVDFFSIGTNDLTQYTLALDRQNSRLEPFFDAHHEAVLKLIEMTARSAHRHGIWAGICGELGADSDLTETFAEMGIDELSVSPSAVLGIREKIRSLE